MLAVEREQMHRGVVHGRLRSAGWSGPRNDSQSVLFRRPHGSWVAYVTPAGMRRTPFGRRPPAFVTQRSNRRVSPPPI
jgi:hypothetical protein